VRSLRHAFAVQINEPTVRSPGVPCRSYFDGDVLLQMYAAGCRHFGGCLLRDELLPWAVLRQANFNRADLSQSVLEGVDFSHATMQHANLQGADLTVAVLACTDLFRANLRGADLRGADLTHANLQGADLTRARLQGAEVSGAIAPDGSVIPNDTFVDGQPPFEMPLYF
ncbi:MAG: pentapeptide repeat-containing protein, partial [Cyanobacteria bacterium J06648_11]